MILFQIVKGLCLAFAQGWRALWRGSGRWVQISMAVIVLGLVGAFVARQARKAFVDRPPSWLQPQDLTSPPLSAGSGEGFTRLVDLAQQYASQHQVPFGAVRLTEVQPNLKDAVLWTTDIFHNPGFNPLSRFERSFPMDLSRFVGYYTRQAEPLAFTVKHSPSRPKDLLLTIHMPGTVAPGATEIVFRLERQVDRSKPAKDGKWHCGFGRMPGETTGIQLWAVRLPSGVRLARYAPEKGATVTTDGVVQVAWVNVRLDTNAPPVSLAFSAAQ